MNKALATFFIATIVLPFRIRHVFLFFNSISIHDIALVVFGFFLLLLVLHQNGTLYIGNKGIFFLLCVPLSIGILSLAWTRDVLKTTYYLVMVVEAVLSYLIIVNLFHNMKPSSIMKFMSSMFISMIVVSVLSYLRVPGFAPFIPFEYGSQAYNQYTASYYSRLSSPFLGLSNNLASVVSFFFFLSWAWYIISRRRSYLILSILTFLGIIMTMSRGVFLAIILTIPFFILWQKIKVRKLLPLLISVVLLTAALVAVINVSNESFRVHGLPRLDIYRTIVVAGVERLQRAAYAIEKIIESPLYGYGARLTLDAVDSEEVFIGNVHNTYLEQMLWFGVPLGSMCVISLLSLPIIMLNLSSTSTSISRVKSGAAAAIICQLFIWITQASFEGQFLKIMFYMSVGFSVALVESLKRRVKASVPEEALTLSESAMAP